MAHHQSKIVGGDLDRVALLHIEDAAQPRPAQGADIENVGKAALDLLAAQLEGGTGDAALQPGPIVVDRAASSPCQRAKPFCCFSDMRVFHAPPSSAFRPAREW